MARTRRGARRDLPGRGRYQGQVHAWPPTTAAARRRLAPVWPTAFAEFAYIAAQRIRTWVAAEVGPGRLFPWLAIAFGLGIVVYFTADHEPVGWAAFALSLGGIAAVFLARRHAMAVVLLMGAAAAAAGFATATLKTALLAHPVLQRPAYNVRLTGFVETREELERRDRIVVRTQEIDGARLEQRPERVRLSVRRGKAPPVASFVERKARLRPPLEP